jgi:hypothetical protein
MPAETRGQALVTSMVCGVFFFEQSEREKKKKSGRAEPASPQ